MMKSLTKLKDPTYKSVTDSQFKKQVGPLTLWVSFDELKEHAVVEIEGHIDCSGPDALPLLQQLQLLVERYGRMPPKKG